MIQNATPQKKLRDERKRKLESMDEVDGKGDVWFGLNAISWDAILEKCNKSELIKAICRITISASAAHDQRLKEMIRTGKTLDLLTEALNRRGSEVKRYSVYLHLLP